MPILQKLKLIKRLLTKQNLVSIGGIVIGALVVKTRANKGQREHIK